VYIPDVTRHVTSERPHSPRVDLFPFASPSLPIFPWTLGSDEMYIFTLPDTLHVEAQRDKIGNAVLERSADVREMRKNLQITLNACYLNTCNECAMTICTYNRCGHYYSTGIKECICAILLALSVIRYRTRSIDTISII